LSIAAHLLLLTLHCSALDALHCILRDAQQK
jgi:hypothetical protein